MAFRGLFDSFKSLLVVKADDDEELVDPQTVLRVNDYIVTHCYP